jgi:ATP-binding protein involved in chromosome partitioning
MSPASTERVESAVKAILVPFLELNLDAVGAAVKVETTAKTARVAITLGFPVSGIEAQLAEEVRAVVGKETGVADAEVNIDWKIRSQAVQAALTPLPNVKNIIAVASGKGGVGKSTTAVNLALALSIEGSRVGILDADIYGPSQPKMLGLEGQRPVSVDGKTFEPLEAFGLQTISIGFLVDQDKPVIWRGPMVTQALTQMVFSTNWNALDYLIVDLPPGTGDTQLTLTQKVPVSGAVIVTTPQDIALLDARRGLKMFEKVNVRILGVVENMSTHICSSCGHEEALFGTGGGQSLAEESGVQLLGELPLDVRIRREADGGEPTVVADPDSAIAMKYREIARRTAARLAAGPRDRKAAFPDIVVEGFS